MQFIKDLSPILKFYLGEKIHSSGFVITDIWNKWSLSEIEKCHNFMQWLFPLDKVGQGGGPVLTNEDINIFKNNQDVRKRVLLSFYTMLNFFGFSIDRRGENPIIAPKGFHTKEMLNWVTPRNHNYLRITRILKSLRLLGFESTAKMFFIALKKLNETESQFIGLSFEYWKRAMM